MTQTTPSAELARRRAVEDAAVSGSMCQCLYLRRDGEEWCGTSAPPHKWDWHNYDYRVKEKPLEYLKVWHEGRWVVELTPEVRAALVAAGIETEGM